MEERTGAVTFQGNPLTLVGAGVAVGDDAPGFTAVDGGFNPVSLSSFAGRTIVISSVPSLDTPVCDAQTHRFNEEAGKLGADVKVITISMDLPFAQNRWCEANSADHILTLSDHRDASFGMAYGLLIKELRLLARAVIVIDRDGMLRYIQLVKEIATEPDYGAVLDAMKTLT